MTVNPTVAVVYDGYLPHIREKALTLRQLILETADETDGVGEITETLKWGEPGYRAAGGSTIRVAPWGTENDACALFFHCRTHLVETFRELYGERFTYEGNRAIVFGVDDREIPRTELKHCISLALTYHRVKALPLLGA